MFKKFIGISSVVLFVGSEKATNPLAI